MGLFRIKKVDVKWTKLYKKRKEKNVRRKIKMVRFDEEVTASKIGGWIFGIAIFLFIIIGVFQFFYQVDAGERGVLLTFGKPSDVAITEGLHTKIPYVQSVVKMDVKTQKYETDASAASKDLQTVHTKIAVNFKIVPESVPALYKGIGVDYQSRVIQPSVQEVVKSATAQYTAEELITKREEVKSEIKTKLHERLVTYFINVEDISITNFDFSASFNSAIETKVTIEQEALAQKNKLAQVEYEAQQVVAAANGQRDSAIAQATGEAESIRLKAIANAEAVKITGEAQAYAIEAMNKQLAVSPAYIELKKAERWQGDVPQYVMGNSVLPIINIPVGQALG
jgi:regulator of protease activity HflC (stomatin/prohibitin superfamily)